MFQLGLLIPSLILVSPSESISSVPGYQQPDAITAVDYFDPEDYQVGFGDNIWISFPGGVPFARSGESVSTIILPVGLDGRLIVPGMPPLNVEGKSLAELQDTIEQMVRRSYGELSVTSGLARSAYFEVPVTGQIVNPGIVTVNGLTRLSEALESAGGITATTSLSRILVVSAGEDSSYYDLNDFTVNGDIRSNPLMRRNTRIHLFAADESILVEGALSSAIMSGESSVDGQLTGYSSVRAILEYIPGETPQQAVERAGGISPEADIEGCFVQRAGESVNGISVQFNPQSLDDPLFLQPGDRIVVPFAPGFINVCGQVHSTGPVAYSPGMTVNYYIGMAGGFNSASRRNGVKLVLGDGSESHVELTDVVPPGSTIEVPRVAVVFWQEYLAILTGVATVVISYQSLFQ